MMRVMMILLLAGCTDRSLPFEEEVVEPEPTRASAPSPAQSSRTVPEPQVKPEPPAPEPEPEPMPEPCPPPPCDGVDVLCPCSDYTDCVEGRSCIGSGGALITIEWCGP